jgi:cyclophilin family peptidyl-prolyl cis-trans isomerase
MFTACETKNPEVKMQIEFDGETYTLEYKLYREFAPATVKHFLMLAENGYFDGVCVHNFDEENSKMYTGAYTYDANAENGGIVYKNYYDIVASYEDFNHTVWVNSDKTDPTYTLKGEFSANRVKVDSGSFLEQSFGSLTMQYTEKDFDELEDVAVLRAQKSDNGEYETNSREYKYNSATSQFSIYTSTMNKADSAHCTFATLMDKSVSVLEDLLAAISAQEGDFVNVYEVDVDRDDALIAEYENTAEYSVPVTPIVITSVKVTKY